MNKIPSKHGGLLITNYSLCKCPCTLISVNSSDNSECGGVECFSLVHSYLNAVEIYT